MKKWPATLKEAKAIQETLRSKVRIEKLHKEIKKIGTCDVSFLNDICVAVICIFNYPKLQLLEEEIIKCKVNFPYIPGFLSFREGPILEKLFYRIRLKPNILIFDGQGIAHPKQLGIASHMGVILNIPTIGCAKSHLWGEYREPGKRKGNFSYLFNPGSKKTLGCVLRTKDNVKPIFVSPGHLIGIKEAKDIILSCVGKFRLPEPIRYAHNLSIRAQ